MAQEQEDRRPSLATVEYTTRHDLPVLNAKKPTDVVRQFLDLLQEEHVVAIDLPPGKYRVPKLMGFTVEPEFRIQLTENGRRGNVQTPFVGHYIGREYHGIPHPLLLIPPGEVQEAVGFRS